MQVSSNVIDNKMNIIDINFLSFLFTFFVPGILICVLIGFFIQSGIHIGLRIFSPNYISDGEFRKFIVSEIFALRLMIEKNNEKIDKILINEENNNE